MEFQEALHTYSKVGDAERVLVRGLDGVRYLDNRAGNLEKVQRGDLAPSKQTDSAYIDATGNVQVSDPVLGRTLVTSKRNSSSTIVWNPWSEGAAGLADLDDLEWREIVCAEGGNVLGQAVSLEPGSSHEMAVTLSVLNQFDAE